MPLDSMEGQSGEGRIGSLRGATREGVKGLIGENERLNCLKGGQVQLWHTGTDDPTWVSKWCNPRLLRKATAEAVRIERQIT
jgi:hypothetical protein